MYALLGNHNNSISFCVSSPQCVCMGCGNIWLSNVEIWLFLHTAMHLFPTRENFNK